MECIGLIKDLCRINKISQLTVAEKLGVSTSTVSVWFKGDNLGYMVYIKEIAELFGLTPNDLLLEASASGEGIVSKFSQLTENQKRLVFDLIKELLQE